MARSSHVSVVVLLAIAAPALGGRGRNYVWSPDSDICADSSGLDFSSAKLLHSNLGGQGPDQGRQELRLGNVTMVDGKAVDCVITNTSLYDPSFSGLNILTGQLAQVNVRTGTSVGLKFSFVDSQTNAPVMLERFYFTVFDLDTELWGQHSEWLELDGFQAYYVSKGSSVAVEKASRNLHVFSGTTRGTYSDNPTDPFKLSEQQAKRAVAFLFTYSSEISVTFGTKKSWLGNHRSRNIQWSRNIQFGGKSAVTCDATVGIKPLSSADFKETLVINWPGTYYLTQNITFKPSTMSSEVTPSLFPEPDSDIFPQLGGWFLGFFAAVVIQAPNVTFDCQGHTIAMSPQFHKSQRFFSIFELASKPFISAAGPPQFTNGLLSPGQPYSAANVTIQNCILGLSSHHGIHGNENQGVTLKNLRIMDFEVGGIHLNGASRVAIENVDIGPSLQNTFSSELSHAIFLDHLMNTLLLKDPSVFAARSMTNITLRGKDHTVDEVLLDFHMQLQQFLEDGTGALADIFGDGSELPDGSAVYGIVLHKTGPAVHEFGACGAFEALVNGKYEREVSLRKVAIHDLRLSAEQWTRVVIEGQQVMGPAGDVFRITETWDDTTFQYRGDLLADAQLAVGALKKYLQFSGLGPAELSYYFGGVHIPDSILTWASGTLNDIEAANWIHGLVSESSFECFGDAMSHVSKGVVGLRAAYIDGLDMVNVHIGSLSNEGKDDADPAVCRGVDGGYLGKNVYGVVLENSMNVVGVDTEQGLQVFADTLESVHNGDVVAIQEIATRRLAQAPETKGDTNTMLHESAPAGWMFA